jgi:hypothetical protein
MSDRVDAISELATRISEIRNRLRDLDSERIKLRRDLDEYTARFAAMTTVSHEPHTGSGQMDVQILRLLRQNPESYYTSADIESYLRKQDWKVDGAYIRTKLSRLAKRGHIRRVGHGRYMDKG